MAYRPPAARPAPPANAPQNHIVYYRKDQESSRRVLQFLVENKVGIRNLGIKITPHAVPALGVRADPKLVAYLRSIKVTEIPALVTPTGVHLGGEAIIRAYARNLQLFTAKVAAMQQKAAETRPGLHDPPDHDFYTKMLQEDSDEEDELGEGFDAQAALAKYEERRKKFNMFSAKKKAPAQPTDADFQRDTSLTGDSGAPKAGAFDETIAALRRDAKKDPDYNEHDDVMMKAYLENLTESM